MTTPASSLPVVRPGRAVLLTAATVPVATAALLEVSATPVGEVPAFLPAFLAVVWVCDVLTAVLLLTQYRAGGGPRLLALSWAYVWSAAVIVPHALVFRGLVTPEGLLGATASSAPWLWTAWHVGLPVGVGAALAPWPHALTRRLSRETGRTRRALVSGGTVVVAAAGVTALVTAGAAHVPVVLVDGDYRLLTERFGAPILATVLASLVLGLLGVVHRRESRGLEAWALVAAAACCGDVVLTLLARERWTAGWYGARALSLVAALVVLAAMLRELTVLYRRVQQHAVRLDADNRALQEATALRDRLTSVVSHELRGPLTGIQGYLELLEDLGHALPPEEVDRMLGRCGVLTRRLSLLTEDLLTVASVEHGSLVVAPVPLDVGEQLREAAASIPELDIRVRTDPGVPPVLADPLRVQQVLANLLRNAHKYGAAPVLLCAAAAGDDGVRLTVTDSGDGVPEAFVPLLFERFSRAEPAGAARGSGLGLSIVRDLVRAHGGDVAYEPGTRSFVVTLPAAPAPSGPLVGPVGEPLVEPLPEPLVEPAPAR